MNNENEPIDEPATENAFEDVQDTTIAYRALLAERDDLEKRIGEAREALNQAQAHLDEVIEALRQQAPPGTTWGGYADQQAMRQSQPAQHYLAPRGQFGLPGSAGPGLGCK